MTTNNLSPLNENENIDHLTKNETLNYATMLLSDGNFETLEPISLIVDRNSLIVISFFCMNDILIDFR